MAQKLDPLHGLSQQRGGFFWSAVFQAIFRNLKDRLLRQLEQRVGITTVGGKGGICNLVCGANQLAHDRAFAHDLAVGQDVARTERRLRQFGQIADAASLVEQALGG